MRIYILYYFHIPQEKRKINKLKRIHFLNNIQMGASQSLGFDDPDMLEKETPIAVYF